MTQLITKLTREHKESTRVNNWKAQAELDRLAQKGHLTFDEMEEAFRAGLYRMTNEIFAVRAHSSHYGPIFQLDWSTLIWFPVDDN